MKKSFILIRHGSTRLNNHTDDSEDRIRGWADVPLSAKGRQEGRELAKALLDIKIDCIYTSDLRRASETADIIADERTEKLKVEPTKGLRPWDLGEFTGEPTAEVKHEIAVYAEDKPDEPVPDGESFNDFRDRLFTELQKIVTENKDEQIAIVTHHRVERLISAWIKEGCPSDYSFDEATLLRKGEPPASWERVTVTF